MAGPNLRSFYWEDLSYVRKISLKLNTRLYLLAFWLFLDSHLFSVRNRNSTNSRPIALLQYIVSAAVVIWKSDCCRVVVTILPSIFNIATQVQSAASDFWRPTQRCSSLRQWNEGPTWWVCYWWTTFCTVHAHCSPLCLLQGSNFWGLCSRAGTRQWTAHLNVWYHCFGGTDAPTPHLF